MEPLGPVQLLIECPDDIRSRAVVSELAALERRGQRILTDGLQAGLPTIRLVWTNDPEASPPAALWPVHVSVAVVHRRMSLPDVIAEGYDAVLWDDEVNSSTLLPWCGVAALRHRMRPGSLASQEVAPQPNSSSSPRPQSAPTIQLRGKVLIAEDTPSTRDFLRLVLSAAGAEVVVAANGAEAVALVQTERPDLVLMDIEMPVLNGYEAISRLREEGCRIPILVLSGHVDDAQCRERGDRAGATGFLSKGNSKGQILQALVAYMSGSEGPPFSQPKVQDEQAVNLARLALKYLERFDTAVPKALEAAASGEWKRVQALIHPLSAAAMFGFPALTDAVKEVAAALRQLRDAESQVIQCLQRLSDAGSSLDSERDRLSRVVQPVASELGSSATLTDGK